MPPRARRLPALLPAVVVPVAVGLAGACAADAGLIDAPEDSGAPPLLDGRTGATCPERAADGDPCEAPAGTTCPLDRCGFAYVVCTRGRWVAFTGGGRAVCPTTAPTTGERCDCAPRAACDYGCASDGGALAYQCAAGTWLPATPTCADAGLDAAN